MKKIYGKPELLVERFELTQMLSSCSVLIGFDDADCVRYDTDSTNSMKDLAMSGYFTAKGCDGWYPSHQDAEDGVCYHTSVNLVFSS